MKLRDKKWIRFRIYFLASLFLVGLGIVMARAYQLQVLERDKLTAIAHEGYRYAVKLPPKRGTIYDRDGHELAISIEVESIYAHPRLIKNKSDVSRQLSNILKFRATEILRLLKADSPFVWIKRKLPPEQVNRVKALKLEGVGFTKESRRFYAGREIGAHLIGFAGDDNQGLEGLEKTYDRILKGPQNTLILMRDALGRPFFMNRPNFQGPQMHNLVLTIDKDIQYKAEQALRMAVKKTGAKSGQCVILDPRTGEILAMAVVPLFNPNVFRKHRPEQWRNRIITDCYEPGSTIKAFLLAAALEESAVSPQTILNCEQGEMQVAKHIIHDTSEYGLLSVSNVIALSSNIGAVKIGKKLGYERFCDYLRRFGFGGKTGLRLIGERKGFIRAAEKAREIDRATLFFGQGMLSTSIQLATAMGAIANGGKVMRPHVVKAMTDQSGRTIRETRPWTVRRVLSPQTTRKVGKILQGVVEEKGTGPMAAIRGYSVAGKTGTSQKVDPRTKRYSKRNYVALFVGYVPVDHPRFVILVMIDEPRGKPYGGLVAGPVFREVGAWALKHLRINPELKLVSNERLPETPDITAPDSAPELEIKKEVPGLLPDFRGQHMRTVLKAGRALGLKVVLEGTGVAVRQTPRPGSSLTNVSVVKVNFRPPA